MTGLLLVISGSDGSGKTGNLERLASRLESVGTPTVRLWYRPGYSRTLCSARTLLRRVCPKSMPSPGPGHQRDAVFQNPTLRRVWVLIATVDMAIQFGLRVRLLRWLGLTVLCDRYIQDAWIDLALNWPDELARYQHFIAVVGHLASRPTRSWILLAEPSVLQTRRKSKSEPFPDSPAVAEKRDALYRVVATPSNWDSATAVLTNPAALAAWLRLARDPRAATRPVCADGDIADTHARLWADLRADQHKTTHPVSMSTDSD